MKRYIQKPGQSVPDCVAPLVEFIAQSVEAWSNCIASGNKEWERRHCDTVEELCENFMPSGSGFDMGTKFDFDATARHIGARLVFTASFHHMDEHGSYDGWTDHKFTVRATFDGIRIAISGPDRNDLKDYAHSLFSDALGHLVCRSGVDGSFTSHKEPTAKPVPAHCSLREACEAVEYWLSEELARPGETAAVQILEVIDGALSVPDGLETMRTLLRRSRDALASASTSKFAGLQKLLADELA